MGRQCSYLSIFLIMNWLTMQYTSAPKTSPTTDTDGEQFQTTQSDGDENADQVKINIERYLQPNDVGRNEMYDTIEDDGILCTRDCLTYPESRLCYYKLFVEQYHAMGPACDGCPENPTACRKPQCVVADGFERSILTFNRMVPGPAMHVCHGDRIIVDIHNKMPARSLTVHWHGNLFTQAPWMDGVAFISQCPINEGQVFRYDFLAENSGTHFYHSHASFQMFDGLLGVFVVRESKNTDRQEHLYDYDHPSHTIIVQDWLHLMSDNKYPGFNKDKSLIILKPDSYLINGLGSYTDLSRTFLQKAFSLLNPLNYLFPEPSIPKSVFHVMPDKRYRFRIISTTSLTCSFQLSIERHNMELIAMDGIPLEPVHVRRLTMSSGERFDVVISTDEKPSSYTILIEGLYECTGITQTAILSYVIKSGAVRKIKPAKRIRKLPDFNNLLKGCSNIDENICMEHLNSFGVPADLLKPKPDRSFVLNATPYLFEDKELYKTNQYYRHYLPFAGPSLHGGSFADTFNGIACMMPPFPLLLEDHDIQDLLCPEKCPKYCECLHLINVPLGAVVQVTFMDGMSDDSFPLEHFMHIHGHKLVILKQGRKKELEKVNLEEYNVIENRNPVIRDVVGVPPDGFAVIRFKATNPGFWPFHCHFAYHNHNGMVVIFQVGKRTEFKDPPTDLVKCGNYVPPV